MMAVNPASAAPNTGRLYPESGLTRHIANAAEKLFKLPDQWDDAFEKMLKPQEGRPISWGRKFFNNVVIKPARGFFPKLATQDYKSFATAKLPFLPKFLVSESAIGSMIILLFPVTIGTRVHRAYQRGKANGGDFREIGDTLRRDISCLTAFVFFLTPVRTLLVQQWERLKGLQLTYMEKSRPHALTYSQLQARYRIENPNVLAILAGKENKKGLLAAAKGYLDSNSFTDEVRETIHNFQQILEHKLIPAVDRQEGAQIRTHSQAAFDLLAQLDQKRQNAIHGIDVIQKGQAAKYAHDVPEFADFFARYAKFQRLPSDVAAFALTCFAIGLFPVWFNGWWSHKDYQNDEHSFEKRQKISQDMSPEPMPAVGTPAGGFPTQLAPTQLAWSSAGGSRMAAPSQGSPSRISSFNLPQNQSLYRPVQSVPAPPSWAHQPYAPHSPVWQSTPQPPTR